MKKIPHDRTLLSLLHAGNNVNTLGNLTDMYLHQTFGRSYYENIHRNDVQLAQNDFNIGLGSKFKNSDLVELIGTDDIAHLRSYFQDKTIHFLSGYLSRFREVVFSDHPPYYVTAKLRTISESKAHQAAKTAWINQSK